MLKMKYFLIVVLLFSCNASTPTEKEIPIEEEVSIRWRDQSEISVSVCSCDQIIAFINIESESSVKAWGFVCDYPSEFLSFVETRVKNTLTEGWIASEGRENEEGRVIVGGFNLEPLTSSGVLIKLVFDVKSSGSGEIKLSGLVDDIRGFVVTNGVVTGL